VSWLRALRRAEAPVAYSGGFHPKPKVSLSSALPTGVSSRAEFIDVDLASTTDLSALESRLKRHLPKGVEVLSVAEVDRKAPNIQSGILSMKYESDLSEVPGTWTDAHVQECIRGFHAGERTLVPREQKDGSTKIMDLSTCTEAVLQVGHATVAFTIRLLEGKAPRPGEVLRGVFGISAEDVEKARIEKVDVQFAPAGEVQQVAATAQ